jgi:hypothetical protein
MARITKDALLKRGDAVRRPFKQLCKAIAGEQQRAGHVQIAVAWPRHGDDLFDLIHGFFRSETADADVQPGRERHVRR